MTTTSNYITVNLKQKYIPGDFNIIHTKTQEVDCIHIVKVIYSNPATIVFWNDGTKTISKCHKPDTYSPEAGLVLCIMKKLEGSTGLYSLFEAWIPEDRFMDIPGFPITRTINDIRKEYKRSHKKNK